MILYQDSRSGSESGHRGEDQPLCMFIVMVCDPGLVLCHGATHHSISNCISELGLAGAGDETGSKTGLRAKVLSICHKIT